MTKLRAGNAYQRRLIREAKALGFGWAGVNGGGHLRFVRAGVKVHAASTPSAPEHALRNTLKTMRQVIAKGDAQ